MNPADPVTRIGLFMASLQWGAGCQALCLSQSSMASKANVSRAKHLREKSRVCRNGHPEDSGFNTLMCWNIDLPD
jgi:hypothetical protein